MLDWSLVTDDSEITIAIPRAVQRELDRLKDGGNSRRSSRARKACSTFAKIIESEDNRLKIQSKRQSLTVELLMKRVRPEDFPDLDLQSSDDQIVAEAISVMSDRDAEQVTFLSNDTAALTTAKAQGLPFKRLPQEWMLPPEKDERDKTIDELRKKVERLSSQQPELTFATPELTDNRVSTEVTFFPALTDDEVEMLMREIEDQFPMEAYFPQEEPKQRRTNAFDLATRIANLQQWQPASASAIRRYQEEAYPNWLLSIRSELKNFHLRLSGEVLATFSLVIDNGGQQPATNLLVSCLAEGQIIFGIPTPAKSGGDESDDETPWLTAPPEPPAGKYMNIVERMSGMNGYADLLAAHLERHIPVTMPAWASTAHDPNSFYWKPRRPATEESRWQLECEEFRHQHEPYSLEIVFRPDSLEAETVNGVIRCQANASNLPERLEKVIPVRIRVVRGDTCEKVREAVFRLR